MRSPWGGLHFCWSHALWCRSLSKPSAMEDWDHLGYIYLYGKQAGSQQVFSASIAFKSFSSIRSVYPGPSYKSCPCESGAKVLWDGQVVPEQLLCVLIEWKGQAPLGAWQWIDTWLEGLMLLCKCMWIFKAEIDFFFQCRNIDNTDLAVFCFLKEPDWSSEHCADGFFSCLILGN